MFLHQAFIFVFLFRYLLSRGLAWLSGHDWLCSTSAGLRAINLIFAFCLFPLISRLLALVHPAAHHTLFALALVWFPVNLFFAFFYYTDAGSTFFVLLSYLLTTQKRYALAGSVSPYLSWRCKTTKRAFQLTAEQKIGLLSMTFRQTNLIWVCLFFGLGSVDILKEQEPAAAVDMPCCDVDSAGKETKSMLNIVSALIKKSVHSFSDPSDHEATASLHTASIHIDAKTVHVPGGHRKLCCLSGVERRYCTGRSHQSYSGPPFCAAALFLELLVLFCFALDFGLGWHKSMRKVRPACRSEEVK